jgi:hypothetical protein
MKRDMEKRDDGIRSAESSVWRQAHKILKKSKDHFDLFNVQMEYDQLIEKKLGQREYDWALEKKLGLR